MTLRDISIRKTQPDERNAFSCGNDALDRWLHDSAVAADERALARVRCLVDDTPRILGYCALSAHVVASEQLPSRQGRGLPAEIPAVLLGKLARDKAAAGDGIGELLLAAAHRSIVTATATVAARLVVVDAIDDNATGFYETYGYKPMPRNRHRLYRRIKDLAADEDQAGLAPQN